MKLARLFIVALLVLVLPLRGVLAGAAPCEADAFGSQAAHTHDMDAQRSAHSDHFDASHTHQHPGGHSHHGVQHLVKCATSCTVAPVPVGGPHVVAAPASETVEFPLYAEPVANFITAGLERPPRSI